MSWFRDNLEDTEYRLHTRYCKPGAGALDQLHPCHPLVAELMTGALQLRLTGGTSQGQSHTPGGPTVSLQSPEWRESVGRDRGGQWRSLGRVEVKVEALGSTEDLGAAGYQPGDSAFSSGCRKMLA
jgi:hypothetical protein